jgi:hypothetical protein
MISDACRWFALVALLWSCGGPVVKTLPDPKLRYPNARYISAVGEGKGRVSAEAAAKAGVAEQISARIESSLSVRTRSNGAQEDQQIDARVRSSSSFTRAELIQVVPRYSQCSDGVCTAFAVLHRGEADAVLAKEYRAPAERFRRAVEAARQATRITDFTRQFRIAEEAWQAMTPIATWRHAITGAEEVAQDDQRRAQLLADRDKRLAALKLSVIASDDDIGRTTAGALAAALNRMGIAAQPARSCSEGYAIAAVSRVECGTGSFGPRCALPLQAGLRPCPNGQALATLDLRSAKLAGASPRSEADARRRLLERVTAARLARPLADQVRSVLPVP